jgi:hypothetical protein
MTRQEASRILREELNKHKLEDWAVRLNQNPDSRFLGLCSYKDKCIILSAHHIDIHPTPDVINTIRHEVAHALCPGHGHDAVWAAKAREIGCDNTLPCSNLSLSPEIIDAIRSGADVEVTFEEHTIRTPKYNITRLQDKCEYCGKVAVQKDEKTILSENDNTPDLKFIYLECGHTLIKQIPKGTPFHKFQAYGDPNCKHTWDKNNCLKCGRKRPYPFQLEGMKFLEKGLSIAHGVACFDDMGLGKTIQAGGVIKYHPELCNPTLWLVKNGTKWQTSDFIINWMGDDHVPQIINTSKDWLIPGLKNYIAGYDILVPKVRMVKGKEVRSGFDITQFDRVGIKCVVLDECQQIKNVDSSRTQMVRKVVKGRKVIPLSGTPWNNRGSELFPALNMMDPIKFGSEAAFRRQWVDQYYVGPRLTEGGIRNIARFREYTKDIIIRRERSVVMPELPSTNRTKLNVTMDETQEREYDIAVDEFMKWFEDNRQQASGIHILAAMAKMRQLVGIAKIPATLEYIDEFVEDTDRKLIVFAHHVEVQGFLYESILEKYGKQFPVYKIDAGTDAKVRYDIQVAFNNAPRAIIVASQLAAGEGLNLQTCSDLIMHERQWNPGKEQQCEDRCARIGSTATSVNAIYAHMQGLTAIDAQLDAIIERKRIQFHNTMNKTEIQQWNDNAIGVELGNAIINAHRSKKNKQIAARG